MSLVARLRFVSRRAGVSLKSTGRRIAAIAACAAAVSAPVAEAKGQLQCVPYARSVSGIAIRGDAHLWWGEAAGTYDRGQQPEVGSVLAFRSSGAMPLGHVAVVGAIVDSRHVMLNHANWSRPGMIERRALAEDVSPAGDWSQVRVWFAGNHALGTRANATYGFIYARPPMQGAPVRIALPAPITISIPMPDIRLARAIDIPAALGMSPLSEHAG